MSKSFHSAIVVIPPDYLWPQIQNIRKKYDKAYHTWMPHVNLMFPFIKYDAAGSNFREAAKRISNQLPNGIKSFKIKFTKSSIQHFNQGRTCTVHLRPFVVEEASENDVKLAGSAARKKPRVSRWAPIESSDERCKDRMTSEVPTTPGSYSSPSNVEGMTKTIQVTCIEPSIPIPAAFQNLPAASLSSLKDAVWSEDDVLKDRSWRLGLSLEDVPQTCGGVVTTTYNKVQVYSEERRSGSGAAEDRIDNEDDPRKLFDGYIDIGQVPEIQDSTNDFWIEVEKNQPTNMTKKKLRPNNQNQCPTNVVHRNLKQLQIFLERLYPEFSEQSRRESGFQPHLTLGQCDAGDLHRFIDDLKRDWEDILFDVTEIHLISRPGRDEAHVVRESIKLHAY